MLNKMCPIFSFLLFERFSQNVPNRWNLFSARIIFSIIFLLLGLLSGNFFFYCRIKIFLAIILAQHNPDQTIHPPSPPHCDQPDHRFWLIKRTNKKTNAETALVVTLFHFSTIFTWPTLYSSGFLVAKYRSVVMLIMRNVSKVIRMFFEGFHT